MHETYMSQSKTQFKNFIPKDYQSIDKYEMHDMGIKTHDCMVMKSSTF